jgi:K+-transporting ATPase KdpF subunit
LHPLEPAMTALYGFALSIALALVAYLVVALLKPEWFE